MKCRPNFLLRYPTLFLDYCLKCKKGRFPTWWELDLSISDTSVNKAPPPSVWEWCYIVNTPPEYRRSSDCSYGTHVLSAECWLMLVRFPLLLCDSSVLSDSVKFRNNIGTLFLTSQIYVTYLTIQFRVRVQLEIKHKVIQFDTVYLSLKQCILYYSNNYTQI